MPGKPGLAGYDTRAPLTDPNHCSVCPEVLSPWPGSFSSSPNQGGKHWISGRIRFRHSLHLSRTARPANSLGSNQISLAEGCRAFLSAPGVRTRSQRLRKIQFPWIMLPPRQARKHASLWNCHELPLLKKDSANRAESSKCPSDVHKRMWPATQACSTKCLTNTRQTGRHQSTYRAANNNGKESKKAGHYFGHQTSIIQIKRSPCRQGCC